MLLGSIEWMAVIGAALLVTADLCEVESDITPLRWRVARVVHKAFGVAPADLPLETRFMVRGLTSGLRQ